MTAVDYSLFHPRKISEYRKTGLPLHDRLQMGVEPFRTFCKYDTGKAGILPELQHSAKLGRQRGALALRADDQEHGRIRL